MTSIVDLIIPVARNTRNQAEKLVKDIPSKIFSSKPKINNQLIDTNHPAFIIGHLCLYPSRILKFMGMNDEAVRPPANYPDLFLVGTTCHDDPDCRIYPQKDELVSFLLSNTDKVIGELPSISDAVLLSVNTEERSKDRFPLVGAFVYYLLTGHSSGHLGQISAWRRCMGLGPTV